MTEINSLRHQHNILIISFFAFLMEQFGGAANIGIVSNYTGQPNNFRSLLAVNFCCHVSELLANMRLPTRAG